MDSTTTQLNVISWGSMRVSVLAHVNIDVWRLLSLDLERLWRSSDISVEDMRSTSSGLLSG